MKILLAILAIFISVVTKAQEHSCCTKTKPVTMAMLASNASFVAMHEEPLPFEFMKSKGQMISFPTPDGKQGSAYVVSSGLKTSSALFIFHEWWGLNDYIKKEAEQMQKELGNVTVYAVDLFDGKVATKQDAAAELAQNLNAERAEAIIQGLLNRVGKGTRVVTLGWCMGGGWALQAAILGGAQVKGCVMYYGTPEEDIEKLKNLKASVFFIQALQDQFITEDLVEKFVEDLKSIGMGKKITVKAYDADHAFANPSNPKHNKKFTAEAHKLAMDFIRRAY